jgi:AraC-like DNA-binding protein
VAFGKKALQKMLNPFIEIYYKITPNLFMLGFNEISYSLHVPSIAPNADYLSTWTRPEGPLGSVMMSYGCRHFAGKEKISLSDSNAFLGIFYNLGNDLRYSFGDRNLPSGILRKNHYYFIFMPRQLCEYEIKPGIVSTFSLRFSPRFLRIFCNDFPTIKHMLRSVRKNIPHLLSENPVAARFEMIDSINDILYGRYSHVTRDAFTFGRVFNLVLSALEQIDGENKGNLSTFREVHNPEKIRMAEKYIMTHLSTKISLAVVAYEVGLEPRTLARAFMKVYNKPIMRYVFEARMKKAVALLRRGNTSMLEIAMAVGYPNQGNFSTAFRRRYGHPPRELLADDFDTY